MSDFRPCDHMIHPERGTWRRRGNRGYRCNQPGLPARWGNGYHGAGRRRHLCADHFEELRRQHPTTPLRWETEEETRRLAGVVAP